MDLVIAQAALNRDIDEFDIRHAVLNVKYVYPAEEGLAMIVGPSRNGELIEVGAVCSSDGYVVVVHAMKT